MMWKKPAIISDSCRRGLLVLAVAIFIALAGCRNTTETALWQQIDQLSKQNTDLKVQVDHLQKENQVLSDQIKQLAGLAPQQRLDVLPAAKTIKINKHSGLFDKNGDGKADRLVVHLEVLDSDGDSIKAAGSAVIELWDLNAEPANARLGVWEIAPTTFKTLWGRGLMSNYFRIELPLSEPLAEKSRYTLKVTFTDYLTGRVLEAQDTVTVKK